MLGQIILSVVLALVGIVAVLLVLPVGVRVRYRDGVLKLWYCLGPIRVLGYPTGKKTEVKKTKAQKTNTQSGVRKVVNDHVEANRKHDSPIGNLLAQLKTVLGLFWAVKPKLRLKRLELKLHLAAEDPCTVAMLYGGAWAAIGVLVPALEEAFILEKRDLDVDCSFDGGTTTLEAELDLSIRLGRLLYILLRYSLDTLGKADHKKDERRQTL